MADSAHQLGGELGEREDGFGKTGVGDGAGHAPDHRGGLVLDHHAAAGVDELLGADTPVMAHAGEHDGDQVLAVVRKSTSTAGRQ